MKQYHWATLGTGVIANELAAAMQKQGRSLCSVANRTYEKGVAFAEKYGIKTVYPSIDDVFADENVDIIYISTPHNTHIDFVRKALRAGKHVLCEKSVTLNSDELHEAVSLAREHHAIFAEAMTIYHMPLYREIDRYLQEHELGEAKLMTVNFGSYKQYDMTNRFFNRELAGGALLDIGVYALSLVRRFIRQTPDTVQSLMLPAPTGVDETVGILLQNPSGQMAQITLSLHTKQPKRAMIAFEKGYLEIMEYPRAERASFTYTEDGHTDTIEAGSSLDALLYEVQDMELAVSGAEDRMCLAYSQDVMQIMTDLRSRWGLQYPEEMK